MAEQWRASFQARYQARARASTPSRPTTRCARSRRRSQKAKSTDGAKVVESMTTLDLDFVNSLGRRALRARSHAALRQPRHPQGEGRRLHLGAVAAHRLAGVSARPRCVAALALLAALRAALARGRRRPGERRADQASGSSSRTRSSSAGERRKALEETIEQATREGLPGPRRADRARLRPRLGGAAVPQAAGLREVPRPGARATSTATGCWS